MKALHTKLACVLLVFLVVIGSTGGNPYYEGAGKPAGGPGKENLISYYRCEDGASPSTVVDDRGAVDLTANGTIDDDASGKINNALGFVSTSSEYANADSTERYVSYPYSYCGWAKLTSTGSAQTLFSIYDVAVTNHYVGITILGNGTTVEFPVREGSSGVIQVTGQTPTDGNWHFYACVLHSATERYLYIGTGTTVNKYGSASETAKTPANLDGYALGAFNRSSGPENYTNGSLDEWSVWNRALTDAEVTWLFNNGNGRSYNDL